MKLPGRVGAVRASQNDVRARSGVNLGVEDRIGTPMCDAGVLGRGELEESRENEKRVLLRESFMREMLR